MNKNLLALALALSVPLTVIADDTPQNKPGKAVIGLTSITATVEAIDYHTRQVTLKGEHGKTVTFKVGEAAHNFNQVKKGDTVTFDYLEALAVDVRKASGPLGASAEMAIQRAPLGAQPKGIISETLTLNALVEAIDYDSRMVTLKGPEGKTLTLKVGDQVKRLNEVTKGDQVTVVYTEALGVEVTPKG